MRAPVPTAIAIAFGLVVLLGYFIPSLGLLQVTLLGWAVILAGVAALVGIYNMLSVHWRRLATRKGRDIFSVLLLASFVITLGLGLWLTPASPDFQRVVTAIQVPMETSLMAILTVTLAYASLRLLQRRKGWMTWVFVISALVFLIISSSIFPGLNEIPVLSTITSFFNRLPMAGARGILLGIALGSLTTGLRVLMGIDRPYTG
jgi:hypothetical protein